MTKRSEKIYNDALLLLDSSPHYLLLTDAHWNIINLNEPMAKSLGSDRETLIGTNILTFLPPDITEQRKKQAEKAIRFKKPVEFIDCRQGRWFKSTGIPVFNNEGKFNRLVTIVEEISKIKTSEKKLKDIETIHQLIIDHAPLSITIVDSNGIIRFINKFGAQLFNNTSTNLTGKSLDTILSKNEAIRRKKGVKHIIKTGKPGIEDLDLMIAGLNKKFLSYSYPIHDDSEVITSVLNISLDITDKAKAQKETRLTKEYLKKVIDSASEIIFTVTNNYKLRIWNSSAEHITGYKRKEVINKTITSLGFFKDPEKLKKFINNMIKEKPDTLDTIVLNTKFNNQVLLNTTTSLITDSNNHIEEILIIGRDITAKRDHDQQIGFGNCYLITNVPNNEVKEIFTDFLKPETKGLYITRSSSKNIHSDFSTNEVKIVFLSSRKNSENIGSLEEFSSIVLDFLSKNTHSIILFDRIDFLIGTYSFDSVMNIFYKINDKIIETKSIFLLAVNTNYLNPISLNILKEEFKSLQDPIFNDLHLSKSILEILEYIFLLNNQNKIVSYRSIGVRFSLSNVTVRKRIESLIHLGLIYSIKKGRLKEFNVTKKGIMLIKKRLNL